MPILVTDLDARRRFYDLTMPDMGRGWWGIYRVDADCEEELKRAVPGLTRVRIILYRRECWYAMPTPALPFLWLAFRLHDYAYPWLIREVLYRRLHLIRRPPMGFRFEWQRDFRPLAWIRRVLGKAR